MAGVEVFKPGGKNAIMDKKQDIFFKIANMSFYIGVIIEVMIVIIDKSEYINPIEGRLFQLTFLLFSLKVFFTKYSAKEYGVIVLFLILGGISYFETGRNEIIRLIMLVAACKNIDMKRCLKLVFYLTIVGCGFLIFLSLAGIYGKASLTMDFGRGNEETRYMLGLGHPNALQCMIWAVTVLYLYLYGEKMKWYVYLCLLGVNGFFFYLTDSKTSLLVAVFAIFYVGVLMLIKNTFFQKFCCVCGGVISTGCIILSVVIAANAYRVYNFYWYWEWSEVTEIFLKLDNLLTGRIHSLVGTERWEGTIGTWKAFSGPENNYFFDLGWIRLFYWYGIIPAFIFIIVMFILMVYCVRQRDYLSVALITAFAVYSFSEAHGISVYLARNYVFFLIGAYWNKMLFVCSEKECYWWRIMQLMKEKD